MGETAINDAQMMRDEKEEVCVNDSFVEGVYHPNSRTLPLWGNET